MNTETVAKTSKTRVKTARVADKGKTKIERARSIYKSLSRGKNGPNRQRILARFRDELPLSENGAKTYYQMIKKELAA